MNMLITSISLLCASLMTMGEDNGTILYVCKSTKFDDLNSVLTIAHKAFASDNRHVRQIVFFPPPYRNNES